MQLILLAAGKGSRLKSKTKKIPKCLVEINGKSLIDYNLNFFNRFNRVIVITGYKNKIINEKFKKHKNFHLIYNKNYKNSNMVESMMLAKNSLNKNDNIVICYSDIIFDKRIYNNLKGNENLMLVNSNWLDYWKLRTNNKVWEDAEDLKVLNGNLIEIGKKISRNKLPKYQYMGIFKIKIENFVKIYLFYKKLRNKTIDMTSFINLVIHKNILKFKIKPTKKLWLEIDNYKDITIAKKIITKNKIW